MGAYARATFRATFKLAAMIAVVLAVAGGLIVLFETLGARGFWAFMLSWQGIAFTLVAASLYAWARGQVRRPQTAAVTGARSGYGAGDRLLHQFALGSPAVAETAFALDQQLCRPDTNAAAAGRHVFVSGLARAGTTVLMRRLYASGAFRSLTYRDMPFVLAPNLWRWLGGGRGTKKATERAHGDSLMVDVDSPESLDEVFWRIFDGESYITRTSLSPHAPDARLQARFVSYVGAVLARSGRDRYLSKNNNNILRLGTLRSAFPNALILIPFRSPLAHADSLLRQHRRFTKMQGEDPFVLTYMDWLAHHEFGRGHRPFRFGDGVPLGNPDTPDYWVELWLRTYNWLLDTAPGDALFVSYERLCSDPEVWRKLALQAGIDTDVVSDGGFQLTGGAAASEPADTALSARARMLYDRLSARAAADLEAA